jgi:hypothetical protein
MMLPRNGLFTVDVGLGVQSHWKNQVYMWCFHRLRSIIHSEVLDSCMMRQVEASFNEGGYICHCHLWDNRSAQLVVCLNSGLCLSTCQMRAPQMFGLACHVE